MQLRLRRWWKLLEDARAVEGRLVRWRDPQPPARDRADHCNPNHTLVMCLRGVVRVSHPGGAEDLLPGDRLVIAAGVWHRHERIRPGSVWFGQGWFPAWSDLILGDDASSWHGRLPMEPSRALLTEAIEAASDVQARSAVSLLLDEALSDAVTEFPATQLPALRMYEVIAARAHLGIGIDDVVRASGLSRNRAFAVFRETLSATPKEVLIAARIAYAGSLMLAGQGIGEAAREAGFAHLDTFTRAWRRSQGTSPRRWLAQVRRKRKP